MLTQLLTRQGKFVNKLNQIPENGLRYNLFCDSSFRTTSICVQLPIGFAMEDLNPNKLKGITHFVEHLTFLGTRQHPSINRLEEFGYAKGGRIGGETTQEWLSYSINFKASNLKDIKIIMARIQELMFQSLIVNDNTVNDDKVNVDNMFSKEKNVVYLESKEKQINPHYLIYNQCTRPRLVNSTSTATTASATTLMSATTSATIWPLYAHGNDFKGQELNLLKFTPQQIFAFLNVFYQPRDIHLTIVTGITIDVKSLESEVIASWSHIKNDLSRYKNFNVEWFNYFVKLRKIYQGLLYDIHILAPKHQSRFQGLKINITDLKHAAINNNPNNVKIISLAFRLDLDYIQANYYYRLLKILDRIFAGSYSSLLQQEIRQKRGWVYSFKTDIELLGKMTIYKLQATVLSKDVDQVIVTIIKVLIDKILIPCDYKELTRGVDIELKHQLSNHSGVRSSGQVLNIIKPLITVPPEQVTEQLIKQILKWRFDFNPSITAKQISNFARRYFNTIQICVY